MKRNRQLRIDPGDEETPSADPST